MDIALKILFYAVSGINGLIGIVFFIATMATILDPSASQSSDSDKFLVAIGSAAIIGLLIWAFNLAILQGRMGAGFGVVALSYLVWVLIQIAIIILISIKGNWNWQ